MVQAFDVVTLFVVDCGKESRADMNVFCQNHFEPKKFFHGMNLASCLFLFPFHPSPNFNSWNFDVMGVLKMDEKGVCVCTSDDMTCKQIQLNQSQTDRTIKSTN